MAIDVREVLASVRSLLGGGAAFIIGNGLLGIDEMLLINTTGLALARPRPVPHCSTPCSGVEVQGGRGDVRDRDIFLLLVRRQRRLLPDAEKHEDREEYGDGGLER